MTRSAHFRSRSHYKLASYKLNKSLVRIEIAIFVMMAILVSALTLVFATPETENPLVTRNNERVEHLNQIRDLIASIDQALILDKIIACNQGVTELTVGNSITGVNLTKLEGTQDVPIDPQVVASLSSGYTICLNATGKFILEAPLAENQRTISLEF